MVRVGLVHHGASPADPSERPGLTEPHVTAEGADRAGGTAYAACQSAKKSLDAFVVRRTTVPPFVLML